MRFNKLDLNLLVALDAMLEEGNISRAAERMHVSQSAMSAALGRLREYFDDELLVQVGRKMELTPYAHALKEQVHDLLLRVNSTLAVRPQFDPATSDREFRLYMSDFTMQIFLPHVMARLHQQRAEVRLSLFHRVENPDAALSRGELDALILPRSFCTDAHPAETLFKESFTCVIWDRSPLALGELTRERYAAAGHVVMHPQDGRGSFDDRFAREHGIERRIALKTYNFTVAPYLVVGTDLIATLHERVALHAARSLPIVLRKPPFSIPPMEQAMQWHRYKTRDPGLAWLRGLFSQAAQDLLLP